VPEIRSVQIGAKRWYGGRWHGRATHRKLFAKPFSFVLIQAGKMAYSEL